MTKSRTILIVEDSLDLQRLMQELLEMNGFRVLTALNGHEALHLLQNQTDLPGLVIMDLLMPDMDGYDFRKQQMADARLKNIPVVVMSADVDLESKQRQIDAVAYVKKPFDIWNLLEIVDRHCP